MAEDLTVGIVRILTPDGSTAGTGFVVSEDGLIATCSHVVQSEESQRRGDPRPDYVDLVFHATGDRCRAEVEPGCWRPAHAEDVAVLRLEGPLPERVEPLSLGSSRGSKGHEFEAFGYPRLGPYEESPARGTILGHVQHPDGWETLLFRSEQISPGMSGAPVLDTVAGWVVGMVNAFPVWKDEVTERLIAGDRYGRHAETNFAIPTEVLRAVCPALRLPEGCPYRGLQVFEAEHADLYFGREAATRELLDALSRHDFVALVGVSGSGKSSLVRAGLEKGLGEHAIPGLVERPRCLVVPGRNPLLNLALSLADAEGITMADITEAFDLPEDALAEGERRQTADALKARSPQVLADAVRGCAPSQGLLLIVDQFERLYTECDDEDVCNRFIDALLAAGGDRVKVLLALRADYYRPALEHPGLERVVKQGGQVTLGRMTEADLRAAIEEPARATGRSLQPGLAERLIADVHERAGDLPLLEFALTELWERDNEGGVLTLATYEALGYEAPDGQCFPGVQGAIAERAEAVWQRLDDEERRAARRVFLNLVTPGPLDERGERMAEDTSRRAWQAEWDETTRRVVRELVDARLLTTGQDPVSDQPTVEVAHEALIRAWPRAQQWLADYRPFVRWYDAELAPLLRRWLDKERHPDFLLPEAILSQAEHWLRQYPDELSGPPEEYIQASVEKREKERVARERQRRQLTLAAAGAAVVFLILALLAWGQRNTARDAQATAVGEANTRATAQAQAEYSQATAAAEAEVRATSQAQAEEHRQIAEREAAESHSLALAVGAQQALSNNNPDLAIALALEANSIDSPPDQARRALVEAAYAPGTRRRFVGHKYWVWSVAFSPDGRTVLSGSWDHSLRLWEVRSGAEIRRFLGHTDKVYSVAFSPDGRMALSGSADNSLILWNIENGRQIRRFLGHTDEVLSVVFSPDGRTALSGSADNSLILWDVDSGTEIHRLNGHTDKVWSVAFGPDGHTALSGSADNSLILWDIESGTEIRRFNGHTGAVQSVALSPDGRTALSGSRDASLILWDIESGAEIHRFTKHTNWVYGVAFSPDGRTAISGSADASLRLWDVKRGKEIRYFFGHTDELTSVAFSPDGRTALSGSRDHSLRLWNIESGKTIYCFVGHTNWVYSVAISPDDRTALSGSRDHSLCLWDVESGTEIRHFVGHTDEVLSVAFSPDGRTALSGSADTSLILWDIESGTTIRYFDGHTGWVWSVAFSPDGRTALSGSADNSLILWDIESGAEIHRFLGHSDVVWSVAFSPDGRRALSGSADNRLILWDIESGTKIRHLEGHTGWVWSVAFSPDGRTAISGSADNSLILWDIESGAEIHRFLGHTDGVLSVAFSPDGRSVLSASEDTSLRLWDIESGKEIRHFDGHADWVHSVTFSSDGRTALSGSRDQNLRLWRISDTSERLIEWTYANRYVRELTCNERELYRVEPFCDADGNFSTRTPYPIPTPIATTDLRHVTPMTAVTLYPTPTATIDADPTVYDNFENPADDGGFSQSLWRYHYRDPSDQIAQQDGRLVVAQKSEEPSRGTKLTARKHFYIALNTPSFFEAKLMLDPDKHSGNVQIHLDATLPGSDSWFSECGLYSQDQQAQARARCWDTAWPWQEGYEYSIEGKSVDHGTWHTFRIEVDPASMTFAYYIDEQIAGSHVPVIAEELKKARFTLAIGVYGETLIGYIDNVRIGKIEQ